MSEKKIVLLGYMGSGKTTIARLLSESVGIPFRPYAIQMSSNLVNWASVGFQTANATGSFTFEQSSAGPQPAAFFRDLPCLPWLLLCRQELGGELQSR